MLEREQRRVICLAPGESLSGLLPRIPDLPCIAISGSWQLKQDSVALCAQDRAWWLANPDALAFAGRKFSAQIQLRGVENFNCPRNYNSGLLGILVAEFLGYEEAILVGYDMHGGHFHGPHPAPLKNPGESDFKRFIAQFDRAPIGIRVYNATPQSSLRRFPFIDLESLT